MSYTLSRRAFLGSTAAASLYGLTARLAFAGDASATPVQGGSLRMLVPEPAMLSNATTSNGHVFNVSNKIFDGLIDFDFNFNPVPKLATSWTISEDGKMLSFVLREGVKWHDGTPFTARDVEFSALEAWKKLHPRGRSTWANLEKVVVVDDLNIEFHLSKPAPYIMSSLFGAESQIIPRHIYEGTDILTNPANTAPIGTGPFRFVEWNRGQYIYLQRNEDYWDEGKPYLDDIILQFIPDASARAVALEAQEIDIAGGMPVPLIDAQRLNELPYLTIPEKGGEGYSQFVFMEVNTRREHLSDPRVRKAMLHAMDRKFMIENIFFGFAKEMTGPIPHTQSQFYTADVPEYAYDLELAKKLLDEAGLKPDQNGVRLRITCDPLLGYAEFLPVIASYFKSQMALIGIEVDIRNQDFSSYVKRIYDDYDFDVTVVSLTGMNDPTIGIQRLYWSKNIIPGTPFSNASGYSNAVADEALEAAQVEASFEKRREQFVTFQKQVMEDVPCLPIADVQYFTVKNVKVHGTEATPFGISGNFAEAFISNS